MEETAMEHLSTNRSRYWSAGVAAFAGLALVAGSALADQDRYTLTAPNGVAIQANTNCPQTMRGLQ
jgi:hypothetical protein